MDVLIIDDDQSICNVLQRALRRFGFMTSAVGNGLAALATLREERAQAILCDIQMAFLDGDRFYDELLTAMPEAAARVIFITGLCDSDRIRDITERTGRPVVRKPIDMQQLRSEIQALVAQPLTVMTGNAHIARDGHALTKAYDGEV